MTRHRDGCRDPLSIVVKVGPRRNEDPPTFPQAGDKVVITLTPTEVAWTTAEWVCLVGGTIVRRTDVAYEVKAPDPLPTTPGSTVWSAAVGLLHCRTDGQWMDERGSVYHASGHVVTHAEIRHAAPAMTE